MKEGDGKKGQSLFFPFSVPPLPGFGGRELFEDPFGPDSAPEVPLTFQRFRSVTDVLAQLVNNVLALAPEVPLTSLKKEEKASVSFCFAFSCRLSLHPVREC